MNTITQEEKTFQFSISIEIKTHFKSIILDKRNIRKYLWCLPYTESNTLAALYKETLILFNAEIC
jgi:hypothetical protein